MHSPADAKASSHHGAKAWDVPSTGEHNAHIQWGMIESIETLQTLKTLNALKTIKTLFFLEVANPQTP